MTANLIRSGIPALLLALFMGTAPVEAQQSQRRARRQYDQERGQRGGAERAAQTQTLQGTIERIMRMPLRGTREDALVAVVRTRQGRRVLADLGLARHLRDADLTRGDRITLYGQARVMGPHRVFMASRLRTGDDTMTVRRQWSGRGEQDRRQARGRRPGYRLESETRQLTGTIQKVKKLGLRNADQRNLVALVKTSQGRYAIVDLGPEEEARDRQFEQGKRITAKGRAVRVRGRPVLIAFRVQADGESHPIDRQDQVSRVRTRERQDDY